MPEASKKESVSTKAILYGSVTATATALIGGTLVWLGDETAPYGATVFVVLPAVTGFVAAYFARPLRAALLSTQISIVLCFLGVLFTGLEGIVCIFMAAPLIFAAAILGAGLGWAVHKNFDSRVNMLLFPLMGVSSVVAAGQAEQTLYSGARFETVISTRVVLTTPENAWRAIIAAESIAADKPFLLRIGLPVPVSCSIDREEVGAKRTCHFTSGLIEEQITTWDPPKQVDMKVVRVTLPGRHWLGFESASYTIEGVERDKTLITRTTTISSTLRPRWYWRFFEKMGVEAEHRYLFDGLFGPSS